VTLFLGPGDDQHPDLRDALPARLDTDAQEGGDEVLPAEHLLVGPCSCSGSATSTAWAARPTCRRWPSPWPRSRAAGGTCLRALVALVMVVAGLGFRITAVPFHFYAPDVYQGTTWGTPLSWRSCPRWPGSPPCSGWLGFVPPLVAGAAPDRPGAGRAGAGALVDSGGGDDVAGQCAGSLAGQCQADAGLLERGPTPATCSSAWRWPRN